MGLCFIKFDRIVTSLQHMIFNQQIFSVYSTFLEIFLMRNAVKKKHLIVCLFVLIGSENTGQN